MSRKRLSIGILAGYPLRFNMQAVLLNLGRMLENKITLYLIAGSQDLSESLTDLYEVHHVKPKWIDPHGLNYAFAACRSFLKGHKKDIDILMNVSHPYPLGVAVAITGHLAGIPTAVRMTGDPFSERLQYRNPFIRLRKWLVHEQLCLRAYKRATRILPVGEKIGQVLRQRGLPPERIEVIPQPFDSSLFMPISEGEKRIEKERLGLDSSKKVILFVGSLTWGKGADRLLKIISQVLTTTERFQFCVIGDGDKRDIFKDLPSNSVKVVHAVPRREIAGYFRSSDLLLHPTRRDGLPNVVLEALACQIPVLASPVGEIPLYVRENPRSIDEFVKFIIAENWPTDDLPEYFSWERQKARYLEAFFQIASDSNSHQPA